MAFQLSPGVLVTETDLTSVVPAVATTSGGFAGAFNWGPVNEPTLITSETSLVETFSGPDANTAISFFTAANFLGYGNQLYVVRAVGASGALNSAANTTTGAAGALDQIDNEDDYLNTSTVPNNVFLSAKYPGKLGDSLGVIFVDNEKWTTLASNYRNIFDKQPTYTSYSATYGSTSSKDELHIAVIDEDGLITGSKGTVLEKFQYLSKASDAVAADGSSIYYRDVINNQSKYLWWRAHPGSNWGNAFINNSSIVFVNAEVASNVISMAGGTSSTATEAEIATAYQKLINDEVYDISLVPLGGLQGSNATSVITNLCEVRRDCVAFLSPALANVASSLSGDTAATNVVNYRNNTLGNISSSFAVLDSGWKYQYDRYNDVYRWMPLNGDIAGLCARTDFVADPWFSPGGLNRGQIKNVVKLAFNPTKAQRDVLYKAGVNPVIASPGNGTVLFGDKTLLTKPSAFDRINVRRLFIVLEKAIANAAKYQLFEFNDEFTRSQFRNLVIPFLRDVKGRRGITDFKVVCDSTNNPGSVIDRNEFVADIYVKPARSINYITLNFIATRTGISFSEVTV